MEVRRTRSRPKLRTKMKSIIFSILFFVFSLSCFSQGVQTTPYIPRGGEKINRLNGSIGKTSLQVDRSIYSYAVPNGSSYINAYYYYIWFYNESTVFDGSRWNKVSTYIQTINVYSDNLFIGNYYLLITGDYYYITIWSVNPNANIRITFSEPIPYF